MELIGGVVGGLVAAGGLVLVLVAAVVVGGLVIVARRRPKPQAALDEVRLTAGSALVRADARVAEAEQDLEFAAAQFGERATQEYRAALRRAQGDREEVFRLHGLLQSDPGANLRHRERAARIAMLADRIDRGLGEQADVFRQRRGQESGAPERLQRLRERIGETGRRIEAAASRRDARRATLDAPALGAEADAPERAARQLTRAEGLASEAAAALAASAASAVAERLGDAERLLYAAEEGLERLDARLARLDDATEALDRLRLDARLARDEALGAVAAAPDPQTADALTRAVAETDAAVAEAAEGSRDPLPALEGIQQALDRLETAQAASRTQAQRLSHAREAYHAARVQAEAQIAAARDVMGGGAPASARARLEDALVELRASRAAIELDPVEALDAARRALVHARDAEVLAKY
ncbi:hypothetical protein OVN20_05750 [Microcella daejeonensis]|uniref:hypothetical protein n=1 Tax=Microcella daejeonensis TaxID=2994971 RepID=UPI00226F6B80|nr:hypothetical protein [Microcella daejeonensis]WAB85053.1 hypothetical protein OVN20_05750 [Microcella daejeonensis]